MAKANKWLIKSEPSTYSFAQLQKDGVTTWDGVRNFEARNNLRAMRPGDLCLFYHSGDGKEVVGVARVRRAAYPDTTASPREDWSAIDVEPAFALARPVTLATIKDSPSLSQMQIIRRSRLSVVPVTDAEYDAILALGAAAVSSSRPRARAPRPRGGQRP